MMLLTKYQDSGPSGFGQEEVLSFSFRLPWQPEFCMEFISLNNNERGPPKEHPYEV